MAAKSEGLTCLFIYPLRCHNPSTTQRGCFDFYLYDRRNDAPAKPATISSKENTKTDDTDEDENQCENQHSSHVHTLC